MSAVKIVLFWIFIVIAAVLGVYAYSELKKNKKPVKDAVTVLPDGCLLYLKTNDFFELNTKINSQSLIADKLKAFSQIDLLFATLNDFDSLLSVDQRINEQINSNPIHFALYPERHWLVTFNLRELGKQKEIVQAFNEIFKSDQTTEGIQLLKINKLSLVLTVDEGVVLISNAKELIVQALNVKTLSFAKSKDYANYKAGLNENNLLSIYVNQTYYSESKNSQTLNLSAIFAKGTSAGAIDIEPSELKINGFGLPDTSETLSYFHDEDPENVNVLFNNLPYNTVFFEAYAFGSYSRLFSKFEDKVGNVEKKFWQTTSDTGLYNVQNDFNENIGTQLVSFETFAGQNLIFIPVKDTVKALEHLQLMSRKMPADSSDIFVLNTDTVEKKNLSLFKPLLETKTEFAMLKNGRIYFAASRIALETLRGYLERNATLTMNESFSAYKNQHFLERFNYLVYTSPSQNQHEKGSFFKFNKSGKENAFRDFKHFSFSTRTDEKMFKFRLHLLHETENTERNMLWSLSLDTTSQMTPQSFKNHLTGENELCIQDDARDLYLINAKGSRLWKMNLEEKILSPVHVVDVYKNNKFQLLFNTRNHIHLIDRNGKYVDGFPMKLPAEATSPLVIFDYDTNKDYRLLIACKNKKIFNFSLNGKLQEGFVPVKTENEVKLPVQHMIVGESHFLVAVDVEGKIYTFSRKGAQRLSLRNRTVANCTGFYLDPATSLTGSYLIYVDDKSSLINKISFSDIKVISKISGISDNAHVLFELMDDNRSVDVLVTSGNSIKAFDFSGNLIFENESEMVFSESGMYSDETYSATYSFSREQKELFITNLISQQKRKIKATALPLVYDLFKDNKKYMIVTDGNEMNCMLLD